MPPRKKRCGSCLNKSRPATRWPATALVIILAAAGCEPGVVNGNGRPREQTRELAAFHNVTVHGDFTVLLQHGAPPKAELRADGNLLTHIRTDVQNGYLTLTADKQLRSKHPLEVRLVSPSLDAVTHTGRGPLTVKLLDAKAFTVYQKNTGPVDGTGRTAKLVLHVEGSGPVNLAQIAARTAVVTVTRDADVSVTASESAVINHFGSGTITVHGAPHDVDNNNHGSGRVVIP